MKSIPRNLIFIFFIAVSLLAATARAETIRLKSGQVIEGTIVERTGDSIKVDTGLGIPVTYYLDEIESGPIAAHTETALPQNMPAPATEPAITRAPDVPSGIKPVPAATSSAALPTAQAPTSTSTPSTMMQKIERKFRMRARDIASLPPWQAPRLSRDEYLAIQAERARAIAQEHIDHVVFVLIKFLTRYWRELKDAHPLIRTIAETPAGLAIAAIIWLGLYAAICYPLMRLSHRFKCGGWMAWVPVLQILQLLRIADKSPIWFLFLFFPLINILAFVFVWMSITRRLQQPHWLGYLMLVPAVNVTILWYLALLPPPTPPGHRDDFDTGVKFE